MPNQNQIQSWPFGYCRMPTKCCTTVDMSNRFCCSPLSLCLALCVYPKPNEWTCAVAAYELLSRASWRSECGRRRMSDQIESINNIYYSCADFIFLCFSLCLLFALVLSVSVPLAVAFGISSIHHVRNHFNCLDLKIAANQLMWCARIHFYEFEFECCDVFGFIYNSSCCDGVTHSFSDRNVAILCAQVFKPLNVWFCKSEMICWKQRVKWNDIDVALIHSDRQHPNRIEFNQPNGSVRLRLRTKRRPGSGHNRFLYEK